MAVPSIDTAGAIVACPHCGRANRLRFGTLDKATRCASCKSALPPPGAPIEVHDSAAFDAAARTSVLPLLVDFWAPWCGPCKMVAPELERVARANAGRWLVLKVNTDVLTDIAERFRIRSIPTLALIHRGQEVQRATGVRPAAEIERFVSEALGGTAVS